MAQPSITPEVWAATLLKQLGIRQTPGAVQALVGWERAEGGHWKNDARYNPLNTTQPMPGAGNTGTQGNIKVYRDWEQGLEATVKTLKNGRYGGILSALAAGNPAAVGEAIGQTPWGTGGGLVQRTIASTPRVAGAQPLAGDGSAAPAAADGSSPAAPDVSAGPVSPAVTALLSQVSAPRPQPASAGLAPPAFSAAPALPAGYQAAPSGGGPAPAAGVQDLLAAAAQAQGQDVAAPPAAEGAAGAPSGGAEGTGKVVVAPGANRDGVGLEKPILGFLGAVAAAAGREVDVTTGTNHNQFVVGTNRESDHWQGNATDLGVGADARKDSAAGRKGDLLAAHAIQVASGQAGEQLDFGHALAMAKRGGVFNFETPEGRVQVIWRSMTGGDHFNHVHVGVNPNR